MSPLRDLLDELAEDQPAVHVPGDTWTRGRRAHRRGLALRAGAAATLVLAVGLGASLVARPGPADSGPAAGSADPAMPRVIHAVPDRLASRTEDGYRWDDQVAATGLDLGPTAAVFPVNEGALVAVSALDGVYRGVTLPGFDPDAWFRFDNTVVALSPDGTRLAYTWNPYVVGGDVPDYTPSGVRILDLTSGEVTSVRIEEGFGVYAHGFSWSPDGRYLAYNLEVAAAGSGTVEAGGFSTERLDTTTGERVTADGLPVTETGPAVSDTGELVAVGNGRPKTWSPDRRTRSRRSTGASVSGRRPGPRTPGGSPPAPRTAGGSPSATRTPAAC